MSMQERESSGILPCLIDVILINILLFPLLTGKHFVLWLHYCTRWWTAWLQHSPVCLSEEKRYIHHELPFAIRLKELCHHIRRIFSNRLPDEDQKFSIGELYILGRCGFDEEE